MLDFRAPSYTHVDLGDGFIVRTNNSNCLDKHDLLGKGSLHFVNTLSVLVDEKKDELPEADWEILSFTLKRFMIDYEDGEVYTHLLNTHGAEALNYNAWAHFSLDTVWDVCVRTFTDMPTEILEEYGVRTWSDRSLSVGKEGSRHIMEALRKRTDIYGANGGIPAPMVHGILFNENIPDYV